MEKIETANKFMVGMQGDQIVIGLALRTSRMTIDDALNLAAYLVAMVGDDERWEATLEAIEST